MMDELEEILLKNDFLFFIRYPNLTLGYLSAKEESKDGKLISDRDKFTTCNSGIFQV